MYPQWYLDYYWPFGYRAMNMAMPGGGMKGQSQQTPAQQPSTQKPPVGFTSNFEVAPGSPTDLGSGYTQGYLKSQIGKRVKVTFLLGTNTVQDRDGILTEVGISYLVLKDLQANYLTMADLYSVKFVNIYES